MIDQDIVKSCLDQRVVLGTKMLEITGQMGEQADMEQVELDSEFNQRANCMERIDKCNRLLQLQLEQCDDIDEKTVWEQIIAGKSIVTANHSEQVCAELAVEYLNLIAEISERNNSISSTLHEKRTQAKEYIKEARNTRAKAITNAGAGTTIVGNMFF